ncbi:SRPBCC family protein [Haladaptatus sp. DFWS20]|uniref:SRPBCC family protein n=1 Tax=Haladaptatus sp. DFWS20 TaxID=3403467 RepID=UPI003EBD6259
MDSVELSTVVYVPPEEAYEFLIDFPNYANYSKHLTGVTHEGDGGPGTEYDIHLQWWKIQYTVRSEVVELDRPNRIDWKIIKDINAHGHWRVEEVPEEAPEGGETASRVWLSIQFDADSADSGMLDLPMFVSLGWVVNKVKPLVLREAETVVERIVADLEGEPRDVNLVIHDKPDSV